MPTNLIERAFAEVVATIANAGTTSDEQNLGAFAICGLRVPSGYVGGATLSFQAAVGQPNASGAVWQDVYDKTNAQVTVTIAAGRDYALPPEVAVFRRARLKVSGAVTGAQAFTIYAKG